MRRITTILLLSLLSVTALMAQQRVMLSRSALDSLVYPTLSATARGKVVGTPAKCDLGTIGDTKRIEVEFYLQNTTQKGVAISNIRPTCSCVEIKSSVESIEAGESGKIVCEFNPSGRNGEFSIDLFVYTDLDIDRPTERLTLVGEIRADDKWSHLRYTAGDLRLSRREVRFATNTEERIVCANAGDKPLRLSAHPTIEGLALRTEPEVIAPNEKGEIIISYRPKSRSAIGLRTMLIIEGIECSPTERMITVTIEK